MLDNTFLYTSKLKKTIQENISILQIPKRSFISQISRSLRKTGFIYLLKSFGWQLSCCSAEPNFGMKNRKSPVSAKGDLCFEPIQGMKRKDRKGSQAKTLISSGRAKTSSLIPCLLWTWEKGSQGRKDLTINIYADKYTDVALSPYPPVLCALHNKNSRMISILL